MKCSTLNGSRKIITQIKVFTNQLPLLENLHKRNPTLYFSPNCVLCNKKCREDATHIVACDGLRSNWEKAEEVALKLTWNILEETDMRTCNQDNLRRIFFPRDRMKRYSTRLEHLKGLIRKSTFEELLLLIKSPTKCGNILQSSCKSSGTASTKKYGKKDVTLLYLGKSQLVLLERTRTTEVLSKIGVKLQNRVQAGNASGK